MRINVTIRIQRVRKFGLEMWQVVRGERVVGEYWSEAFAISLATELKQMYTH